MLVCIGTSREGGFAGEPAGGNGYSNAGLDWGPRECLVDSIERRVLRGRVNRIGRAIRQSAHRNSGVVRRF